MIILYQYKTNYGDYLLIPWVRSEETKSHPLHDIRGHPAFTPAIFCRLIYKPKEVWKFDGQPEWQEISEHIIEKERDLTEFCITVQKEILKHHEDILNQLERVKEVSNKFSQLQAHLVNPPKPDTEI